MSNLIDALIDKMFRQTEGEDAKDKKKPFPTIQDAKRETRPQKRRRDIDDAIEEMLRKDR